MSEEALRYRDHRGLLDRDEQMAMLVQRVSGAVHGALFYPQAAGVALSYNPYVWNHAIDPQRRASCGSCSGWGRARWIAPTTTTPASSR